MSHEAFTHEARGTFETKTTPEPPYDTADGTSLARLAIAKTFVGDLVATSTVAMLAAGTPVKGSAGYVAMERVVGALGGRSGSFVLQHSGTMNRGDATLSVTVVPDSASGELTGLHGRMKIEIVDKQHFYVFSYAFDAAT